MATEPTPEAYEAAARATEGHEIRLDWRAWSCICGEHGSGREPLGGGYRHLLSLEIGAARPIIEAQVRAKVAAEIRASKPDVALLTGHPFGADEPMITTGRAARIAEGKGDET